VPSAEVGSAEPRHPIVGYILAVPMRRPLSRMNVVANLVIQHAAKEQRPDQAHP
jgi:hypothetical protein